MRTIFTFPSLENPMKNVTLNALGGQVILAMMAWMCFGSLSAQEQERDLERVFIPEARVKAIEASRAGGGTLLPPLGLPFPCRVRTCRHRTLPSSPRVSSSSRCCLPRRR